MLNVAFSQEYGIINNTNSPNVKLKSVNMGDCHWTKGFWADKFKLCEDVMVPHMGEILCGSIGHGLDNFKIAAGLKQGEHEGFPWQDGDFYKWMEAMDYVYAQDHDQKILKQLDDIIDIIGKAQLSDGYIETQVQLNPKVDRYENRKYHEMYNSGHLFTTACIHYRMTGQRNLLDIAIKQANLLYTIFFPDTKEFARFGFNQTQIMGLVELYRTTKDKRYLELAAKFVDRRGQSKVEVHPTTIGYPIGDMVQERTPIRESSEAVGHAVLALYYYAGAADIAAETGEKALVDALDRLWDNVTTKKMYVTGAVGQAHYGASTHRDLIEEGFIDDYNMPNLTAYNETCANVANAMFSYRMLGIHGESKYADIMELVLYNSALSGISSDGKCYFYSNPLEAINGARDFKKLNTETPDRQPYLECFCCPPNLVRTIAKVSGWAYSLSENGLAVNIYGGNELKTKLLDGSKIQLTQESLYPWDGNVKITINECKKEPFGIMCRIPEWAVGTKVLVNGGNADVKVVAGTYANITRKWKMGDVITIVMPMDVKLLEANDRIEQDRNQVAVKRGPVVYCIESPDLPKNTKITNVYLPSNSKLTPKYHSDLLGGLTTLTGKVELRKDKPAGMYPVLNNPDWKTISTTFIPYYAWSNRGQSDMTVWLPVFWK